MRYRVCLNPEKYINFFLLFFKGYSTIFQVVVSRQNQLVFALHCAYTAYPCFLFQLKLNGQRFFIRSEPSFLVACRPAIFISNWEAINVRLRWQRQHSCQTMKKTNNQQSCQNLFSFLWRPHTQGQTPSVFVWVGVFCDCRHCHLALIEVYLLCSRKVLLPLPTPHPFAKLPQTTGQIQGLAGSLNYRTCTSVYGYGYLSEKLPFASF